MIEWSKVTNDISQYTKSVFKEDGQTITESEIKEALNIMYHIIYERSGVYMLDSFSRTFDDALNKAIFTEVGEINPLRNISILLIHLSNASMYLRIIQSQIRMVHSLK